MTIVNAPELPASTPPVVRAGTPVHLVLFVNVRENWGDDPERYREMGLDFPKDA